MRFVDDAAIARALTLPVLIAALEAAHRRAKMAVCDEHMGSASAYYFARHAIDAGRFMATKLITSFPANLAAGKPAVQAVCVLFDGTDGTPRAVLDGTAITYWRTAADSGLGAKYLAREDAETLVIAGAGKVAWWLVAAHRAVRPSLGRVLIWNRTRDRAEALAARLRGEGITADVVSDLRAAVREADIVSTCTRAETPIIFGADVRPGTHLDLVGGYSRSTREADDDVMRRGRLYVDRRESAFDVGDLVEPIASGALRETDVLGDHYDLATGRVAGRQAADAITVFKNAGGGHLDLMTCETVLARLDGRA